MRVGRKPRVEFGNDEQAFRDRVDGQNQPNRRVRFRTHGGVGGRGLVAPSYPITIYSPQSLSSTPGSWGRAVITASGASAVPKP